MLGSLKKIKTFIENNLSDAISDVESEQSITIASYKVLKLFTARGRQYPEISIRPDYTDPTEESAGNRAYFGNPSKRNDIITIEVWDRGNPDQADSIETNVVGYMDSFEKLFMGDYSISSIKGVEILETRYTELFPDLSEPVLGGAGPLLKGATMQIKVLYNII